MAPTKPNIPFPAFNRPFKETDSRYFFGRDDEIMEIKNRLRKHRMVVLTSLPNAGKTSLIRGGLTPELRMKGFPAKAGNKWKVVLVQPHRNVFRSLAAALCKFEVLFDHKIDPTFQEDLEQRLRKDKSALVSLFRSSAYAQHFNYLLVVDPMDDLKRSRIKEAERTHFTQLVQRVAQDEELPVYVLLSVSSRMLNSEESFPALSALVHEYAYFLNTLSEADLEAAIRKPLQIDGGEIEDELCNFLMEKLSFDPEQLPKLQQALFGTWKEWRKTGNGPLKLAHYRKFNGGKLDIGIRIASPEPDDEFTIEEPPAKAAPKIKQGETKDAPKELPQRDLIANAERAYTNLPPAEQTLFERLLKSLAYLDPANTPALRSVGAAQLAEILQISLDRLSELLSKINRSGAENRLVEHSSTLQDPDSEVSLASGEQLFNWPLLQKWMQQEQHDLLFFTSLEHATKKYYLDNEENAIWEGTRLKKGIEWRDAHSFNEAWASLYGKANSFDLCMQFLKLCYEQSDLALSSTTVRPVPPPSVSPVEEPPGQEAPPPPSDKKEDPPSKPKIKIKRRD